MAMDTMPGGVLVADDDLDSRQLLAELLRQEFPNAEVSTARDGQEALRLALQQAPRAVILDLEMPGIDGMDAARDIRAEMGAAAPTLLALSGNSQKLEQAAAERLFDHYLMKPVPVDLLLGYLRALR